MRRLVLAAAAALLVACAGGAADLGEGTEPSGSLSGAASGSSGATGPVPVEGVRAFVSRVIDGDTAEVDLRGREVDVRFIGIDTPETVAPDHPVECFGPQASAYTERRLEGRTVTLEFDVERIDRYGRTLAYVWLGDELFNETLVARGFAVVTTYPPDVRYVDHFLAAQRAAREAGRGLWGACPSS